MKYDEMFQQLKLGNYGERHKWAGEGKGQYLAILPGMQYIWSITTLPACNAGNWLPLIEDYEADDWKVSQQIDASAPVSVVSQPIEAV